MSGAWLRQGRRQGGVASPGVQGQRDSQGLAAGLVFLRDRLEGADRNRATPAHGSRQHKGHKIRVKIDDGDPSGSDWSLYCDDRRSSSGHSSYETSAGATERLDVIINEPLRRLIDHIDAKG